jgi:hypothetical protein
VETLIRKGRKRSQEKPERKRQAERKGFLRKTRRTLRDSKKKCIVTKRRHNESSKKEETSKESIPYSKKET